MGDARVDLGLVIVSEWSVRSVRAGFSDLVLLGARRGVGRSGVKKRGG